MRRVAAIVCTYLVLLGTTAFVVDRTFGATARQTARSIYLHRVGTTDRLRTARPGEAAVVWLGDSTTMSRSGFPQYVTLVNEATHRPSLLLNGPGLDCYGYWSLAGRVVALRPEVVVLIVNLRTLAPRGGPQEFNDLTAEIEPADLPRTLRLPYFVRGMTAPRLLLARALRTEVGEDAFLTYEGTRYLVHEDAAWDVLGPRLPDDVGWRATHFAKTLATLQSDYARPFDRRSPLLAYADATLDRLTGAGIRVLVVVTPMPWTLPGTHYDPVRTRAKIDLLRATAARHGARLLDLHNALPAEAFRDQDCHFTVDGAAAMARFVAPQVDWMLADARAAEPAP